MPRIYTPHTSSSAYRAHAREVRRQVMDKLIRWTLCVLFSVFLCLLDGTSFSLSTGITPTIPALMPVWVTVCAFYAGPFSGAWFGIFCGLLSDAAGGSRLYLLPIVYLCLGFCAGLCSIRMLRRRFWMFLIYDAAASVLYAGYRAAGIAVTALYYHAPLPAAAVLLSDVLHTALYTALWGIFLYLPAKWIFTTRRSKG